MYIWTMYRLRIKNKERNQLVTRGSTRRVRSDKKRDIKPFLNLKLRESIYRLSSVTTTPVKDICESLVLNSLFGNKEIIKSLSPYFKRSVHINGIKYEGDLANETLYSVADGEKKRVSLRLKNDAYEVVSALSYALDCSVSKVTAVLLYESITDIAFIEKYTESYLDKLDRSRKNELKQFLKYIKNETNENYSLTDLFTFLVEDPIKWFLPKD